MPYSYASISPSHPMIRPSSLCFMSATMNQSLSIPLSFIFSSSLFPSRSLYLSISSPVSLSLASILPPLPSLLPLSLDYLYFSFLSSLSLSLSPFLPLSFPSLSHSLSLYSLPSPPISLSLSRFTPSPSNYKRLSCLPLHLTVNVSLASLSI